jgi:hypothetical protein
VTRIASRIGLRAKYKEGILMTDFTAIAASLDERGFCVIPEFLSREEIDFLVAEFRGGARRPAAAARRHSTVTIEGAVNYVK